VLLFDGSDAPGAIRGPKAVAVHTVLLAEDEELLREVAAITLRRARYVVIEAGDTDSAFAAVNHSGQKVDLLITDVMLPGIGGLRLFEELLRSNPALKVVFISGYSVEVVFKDAPLPGGALFLQKPYETSSLLASVVQLLH